MHLSRRAALACAALTVATATAPPAAAATFDSINGAASPPFVLYGGPQNIGWFYTPPTSYDLDGISSNFEPVPNGTGSRTITVQIWTDRPGNGGTLLGQGSFTGNSASGGVLGASFASTRLTGGTSYFVDFLDTIGMGVNLGSWALDANGNPAPSAGATTNLGAWYLDNSTSGAPTFTGPGSEVMDGGSYYTTATGNVSFAEPILYFSGTAPVPEPATMALLLGGLATLGAWARRRGATRG
ncbi:MAG: PEP-CTERM sorting domain-containing protein [Proteobacteria bacterium]|nr:PEP-CTERM sorting domain-containing protein [Pseudomonadota bacterium]